MSVRRMIEPGIHVREHEGLAIAVEIDLNKAHIYDGNGVRLTPTMVRGTAIASVDQPPTLVLDVRAFRRISQAVDKMG